MPGKRSGDRGWRRKARRSALLVLFVMLAVEGLWAWPWSRDMIIQPIVRPLLIMFRPAPGGVAVGSEAPITREAADLTLHNPLPTSPENLAAGRKLFGIYCSVCHGRGGRGDGPVSGGALPAADLTSPAVQQQSDGFLYTTIRNGRISMPSYSESLSSKERWQVILYVRTLGQRKP